MQSDGLACSSQLDRCRFEGRSRTSCMEDRDLLGLVLAGIAVMMFLTGIVLIM